MPSLYIHIPFCEKKCFYCSFVIAVGQSQRVDLYLECLEQEAGRYKSRRVDSVYVGGGTPSYLSDSQFGRLLRIVQENFFVDPQSEITAEANPESTNFSKFKLLKEKGVNRISLGIQSLHDGYLKFLGRNHDARSARRAFYEIRDAGFENVNVDLMFGFPGQTPRELERDVRQVVDLGSEHVSLYALTIEENSRFYARDLPLPPSQVQAEQYLLVMRLLESAGLQQYEISNFARPGRESRHNLNTWQGGEYIGLGVGAHSHLGQERFWNCSRFQNYMEQIQREGSAQEGCELLSSRQQFKEKLLFGLRMNQGVDVLVLEKESGCFLNGEESEQINGFVQAGFFEKEQGMLRTTLQGRLVLDELCSRLF